MSNEDIIKKKQEELIGKTFETKEGCSALIIEYNNAKDVVVEFQDEHKYTASVYFGNLKKGTVKNPYYKSVCGVGYVGVGDYKVSINRKATKCYDVWNSMLKRCYDNKYQKNQQTYKDVTVCEEWHNFQNFAKWFNENYYEIDGERMELDKDILVKGNKVYSPETCVFVPKVINTLFVKKDLNRGNLPIGVHKMNDNFQVRVQNPLIKSREHIGTFSNVVEAFENYKNKKEEIIKNVANVYKGFVPDRLYNAMMKYEVEITD